MVTLDDIARNLGLNKTTVSKALNRSSDLKQETIDRVQAEAKRLGYVRRPRKTRRLNRRVGIIMPNMGSPYYSDLTDALNWKLREKGYQTLIALSSYSNDREAELLTMFSSLDVDGIIIAIDQTGQRLSQLQMSVPTVVIGLNFESIHYDVISIDERRGLRAVVEHLIQQRRRRIAFIGDPQVDQRLAFLRSELHDAGFDLPDDRIFLSDPNTHGEKCGRMGIEVLFSQAPYPDAIVTGYDRIALGAYRTLSERGLRVPQDVALVGFDDSDFCRHLPVSLTSVSYDIDTIARVATAILLSRVTDPGTQAVQTVAITPTLMIRESTGASDFSR